MKPYVYVTFLVLGLMLVGCQAEETEEESEPEENAEDTLSIYTSLYVLEDFAEKIGGEFVEAESVYPPNADAHTYEPSSNDMVQIAESDAFIYSGLTGMEPFADTVDDALADEDAHIIPAAENIDLRGDGHDDGEDDAHGNDDDHQSSEGVEVEGLADHYHTGDDVSLTAELNEDVDYDHWHWYSRDGEDEEWEEVSDQDTEEYEAPAEDGQELMAVLYDDDHEAYAQSAPVIIEIDDHDDGNSNEEDHDHGHEEDDDDNGNGHDQQASEGVEIEGLLDHYHTGDDVSLTAELNEDVDYDHWHWYSRDGEDGEWEAVSDQDTEKYEAPAEDGQELMAVLYDDDHEAYAQSAPVTIEIDDHDGEGGDGDPHIFLDPVRSIELAENIKDELVELLPEEEAYFEENFEQLSAGLEDVDQELQRVFDEADRNQIIVSHAAYGYWEERYGLEQLSVHGLSSTEEPSQSDLAELVNTAEENDLGYVIFENNVSSNITEVIQNEIGAESLIMRNMESISEDDLEAGEDYFSMMEMNIETLEIALNN
ncbi:zinc ABC transporter substrate-binding protein [Salicibibacter cibarius]|uniref:Zinc ABC transporter substrate-binding protein n=1 Tax=Salicibibacter cibarius TaxID=2743000 RepID=A0A7T7CCL8_9BACI|nr:zinc ABC transporter substrate-binding protein [Salicibibacter cibarius]QQK77044.1 zinc ABC transporter substrate-binding protein [Salicibibacter cibarius]